MTELSALGIKVTSTGVVKTTKELTDFSKAASAAKTAARNPINVKVGALGISKALADIQKLDRALRAMGGRGNTSSAKLAVTGASTAIREINRFTKAVTDARSKVGSGITVQLRANGSQAAVRNITEYQRAVNQAQQAAGRGANFNMVGSGSSANISGATTSIVGLGRAVLGLASAFGVLAAGRFFAKVADESNLISARLKVATAETGNYAQAMDDVRRIAASSRSDLDTTATLYQRLMISSKELGFAQKDVAKFTETVGKSFKVSGASTIEAANATRQLIQALQSGVLRGDEFRSVMEQAPRLAQAIAEGMGTSITKLRALAEDGALTTNAVFNSVLKSFDNINSEFDQLPVTFGDAMGQIYNAAVITFGAFDQGGKFSNAITSFLIGGSQGMMDMERSAQSMGIALRAEIDGIVGGFNRTIDAIVRLDNQFGITSNLIIPGLRAINNILESIGGSNWGNSFLGYLRQAIALINPITAGLAFIRAMGAADRAKSTMLAGSAANMEGIKQQIQARLAEKEAIKASTSALNANTGASGKAAGATKRLTEAQKAEKKAIEDARRAREQAIKAGDNLAESLQKQIDQFGKSPAEIRRMNAHLVAMATTSKETRDRIMELVSELERLEKVKAFIGNGDNPIEYTGQSFTEYWKDRDEKEKRIARDNADIAIRAAHEVAEITGLRGAHEFVEALNESLPTLFQDLGEKFGKTFAAFSKGAALGGSFAQMIGGSSSGGALGGGLGQIAGEAMKGSLGKLGQFAGPLGAIAGGILGGVIGGMVKSTPRASATVSIIAGEAMDTAIKGNKAALKKAAGQMADSVITGLIDLADQLGGELTGDAKVSVGMRKKNYRVDPTGQGITKTSRGAIDFGEDQAAAIAYAIQIAIQQGVLGGLSESMKRLIMADGDLQTQIQKALSFKDVFDQLAQRDDPAKWAQDQVTAWHDAMAKIFAEAGATADELAELERLTGIKRADAAKEAADKIAQAAREALERQNQIRDKNIELLTALGKIEEAEAMARQARIDDAPDYLRALQAEIEAANMAAAAATKAAQTAEEQAAAQKVVADQAREIAIAIAELENPQMARLMRLADERALVDAANLAEWDRLQALKASTEAAAEAAKAAEELAAKIKAIADERYGLETQWYQLIGDEATLRARALARLDESNRALQQQIWAEEDRREAIKATQDLLRGEIDARNDQISAINSTISSIAQASEKWSQFAKDIREFRAGLFAADERGGLSFEQTQREFQRVSRMAALGDEASLGAFTGTAQSYLDAARNNAASLVDYQRAIGLVAGAADAAAEGADGVARQAAQQLGYLYQQVGELEALNTQAEEQIALLNSSLEAQERDIAPTLKEILRENKDASEKAAETRAEEKAENIAIINLLSEQNSFLRRVVEDSGINVNLPDTVNVSGVVSVTNTPLPVTVTP